MFLYLEQFQFFRMIPGILAKGRGCAQAGRRRKKGSVLPGKPRKNVRRSRKLVDFRGRGRRRSLRGRERRPAGHGIDLYDEKRRI